MPEERIIFTRIQNLKDFPSRETAQAMLPAGPFATPPLIICENQASAEWLKTRIAEKSGIAAGLSIVLPSEAVRRMPGFFPAADRWLDEENGRQQLLEDDLAGVLFMMLQEIAAGCNDGEFSWLCSCLADDNDEEKIFYMAETLSGLFREYSLNHEIIQYWADNLPWPVAGQAQAHEKWQRLLWKKIFINSNKFSDPFLCFRRAEANPAGAQNHLPSVFYFGAKNPGRLLFRWMYLLSGALPVTWLWPGSTISDDGQISGKFRHWFDYPWQLHREYGPKIITDDEKFSGLGRQTALAEFLTKNTDTEILKKILEDQSLKIIVCPGRMRQAEIIKDMILDLIKNGYAPSDLAVMMPDPDAFMPVLEPVLDGVHDGLPVAWISRGGPDAASNVMISGFLDLLNLPGSSFEASLLIRIFSNPCLYSKYLNAPAEQGWADLIGSLNIRSGVNTQHRSALDYTADRHNTWEQGLDRILAGLVFDADRLPGFFSGSGGVEIFPYYPAG